MQSVQRPNLDYRGFEGQVASGTVKKGAEILVLPSGKRSHVKGIDSWEGEHDEAFTPQSVTLRLEDEIDISRGDMLVDPADLPHVGRHFEAHLVWMSETPLDRQKSYIVKHTSQSVRAQIDQVISRCDMDTLEDVDATGLALNDIGRVAVTCHRALYFDAYKNNRETGAFVLVDSLTNNTVGAGMIIDPKQTQDLDDALREIRAGSGLAPKTQVSPKERRQRMGQVGATVWLTGLPGSGRWALAYALERRLFDVGHTAHVVVPIDEDLRTIISAAKACTDAGLLSICAFPSYTRAERQQVRERIGEKRFFEIFVDTAIELCRERRPKANFDGFESPTQADVTLALDQMRVDDAVELILRKLSERGQFDDEQ